MPELFNVHGFGPSVPVTEHATCSWVDHGVSGHRPATSIAILRLAFATAAPIYWLSLAADNNSPAHYAKGTPSHIALASHSAPTACKCMVSGTFNSARRRAFHRSIALLVHYRSLSSI